MKHDCGMLLPDAEQLVSDRYKRAFVGIVDEEFMILMATPGFLPRHFAKIFYWDWKKEGGVGCREGREDAGRVGADI